MDILKPPSQQIKKQVCFSGSSVLKKTHHQLNYIIKHFRYPKLLRVYSVLKVSILFNKKWYLSQYPDIAAARVDPLFHYILYGVNEGRNPSILFETNFYLEKYPDVAKAGINPLFHYLIAGRSEGRWPTKFAKKIYYTIKESPLFDSHWYLSKYPDVAGSFIEPVRHYIEFGADEKRNPSKYFDTHFYLETYPDVLRSNQNPLYHYITLGQPQGRQPTPFDQKSSEKWAAKLRGSSAAIRVSKAQPLVSVILPTKDRIKVLPSAIESIISQTYKNWELLIVDDHSCDGTFDTIKTKYQDSRIRVLKSKGNGVCHARNHGLRNASGKYIAYLDSDNTWNSQYLELMLLEIERAGSECAYSVLKCLNVNLDHEQRNYFYRLNPFNYEKLKLHNFIDLNVFMHKKSLFKELGGFDVNLRRAVDWDLILRYTNHHAISFAYFVGAEYDAGPNPDRLTNCESMAYRDVVRNKHLINWKTITDTLHYRDTNLVSIVICVHGRTIFVEMCLAYLFTHEAGEKFEVILVDNGNDLKTAEKLKLWASAHPSIKLIKNPKTFSFALGQNIGFASSSGSRIVFLNSEIEVSPEWLRSLVRPLNHPEIKGAQTKLLYPDGSIKSVGIVFSDQSPNGYPIYSKQPGDFYPTQQSRNYSSINSTCMAIKAETFAHANGFDPIYVSGQEDIDLCLRIGNGKPVFRYVADSVAVYHGSKKDIIDKTFEEDQNFFNERWQDIIHPDDVGYYKKDKIFFFGDISETSNFDALYSAKLPTKIVSAENKMITSARQYMKNRTIAIKIRCPNSKIKDHWGDYHFAVALASAFMRKGVRARVDFAESWEKAAQKDDINLVLRGLLEFKPNPDTINLMWMISHPDKVSLRELGGFDHVFVASLKWAEQLSKSSDTTIESLLQCTDPCRFHPEVFDQQVCTNALFVANSRKVLRTVVRDAMSQGIEIDIFGEMWEGLAPSQWVKAEKIDNVDLPRYYASARVVLNDHWESMRERGFISNRIFDVLACGTPLVSDRIAGLPEELTSGCHFFDKETRLCDVIQRARRDPKIISTKAMKLSNLVREKHSFDARVNRILKVINKVSIAKEKTIKEKDSNASQLYMQDRSSSNHIHPP